MSALRVDVPVDGLAGGSALYRDFVTRSEAPVHRRVGAFRAGDESWRRAMAPARALDAKLVERMLAYNESIGASREVLDRLRELGAGRARTVVTGQQPGVVVGSLLSLYKAATAAALAGEIERRWKTPCVPVFWLGCDDDDFDEIRELALIGEALSLFAVSLEASAHAPGRFVGNIAGSAVARAWDAARAFLPRASVLERVDAVVREGRDLGGIAARVLSELTGGSIAVIDGREGVLREAARDTMLGYFDREDGIRSLVTEAGEALRAEGYHAQLEAGADSGLFLVRDGTRRRIPVASRAEARGEFGRDITSASPGVVARNLVQDSAFAPIAAVLGPAEIAYRAQLARVYDVLGVERPVAFPRLSATFVPPAVCDAATRSGVDPALLAADPGAWVARVTQSLESAGTTEAARAFERSVHDHGTRFAAAAAHRLDARAREKLERRIAELVQRAESIARGAVEQDALAGAAQWPWLARAAELFARAGEPQERYLSALAPYALCDREAWSAIREIAARHVGDALDGRVLHRVYSA